MSGYDVFISHKSEDKAELKKVESYLESQNISYWSDSKIKEGSDWPKEIENAISKSKIVLVLLSKNVIKDPYNMESEIVSAVYKRLKFIVIKLDDTDVIDYSQVISLYLTREQWINANFKIEQTFESLLCAIKLKLTDNVDDEAYLNTEMQKKLRELAKKQEEEYFQNLKERVKAQMLEENMLKVKKLINDKLFQTALTELKNLMLGNDAWQLHELRLICLTREYKEFSSDYKKELEIIKELNAPLEEIERINNNIIEGKTFLRNEQRRINERRALESKLKREKELVEVTEKIQSLQKEFNEISSLTTKMKVLRTISMIFTLIISMIFSYLLANNFSSFFFLELWFLLGIIFCYTKKGIFRFVLMAFFTVYGYCLWTFIIDVDKLIESSKIFTPIVEYLSNIDLNFDFIVITSDIIYDNFNIFLLSIFATLVLAMYLTINCLSVSSLKKFRKNLISKFFSIILFIILALLYGIIFFLVYALYLNKHYDSMFIGNDLFSILFAIISFVTILFSMNSICHKSIKRTDSYAINKSKEVSFEIKKLKQKEGELRAK